MDDSTKPQFDFQDLKAPPSNYQKKCRPKARELFEVLLF